MQTGRPQSHPIQLIAKFVFKLSMRRMREARTQDGAQLACGVRAWGVGTEVDDVLGLGGPGFKKEKQEGVISSSVRYT